MIPAQPTKSSRRSSILKIPKSRSSSYGGDQNASAIDDSPTVTNKLKRRVSFAEKKHVKEFCDSFEQGTVWDNTYEESESSQMKTNISDKFTEITQLSNINGYQVNIATHMEVHSSLTVTNKSLRRSVPKLVRQNAVDYDSFPSEIINDSNKVRQSTILNTPEFLVNKENIPEILKLSTAESSLVEDEEIITRPQRSFNTSPYPKFSVYCDRETEKNNVDDLNCSNYENVSMECTILAGNSSPFECSKIDENELKYCKNIVFNNDEDPEKTIHTDKTQMFHNKTMEFTEVIPNTRFSIKPSIITEEKTRFFHNAAMEITEPISNVKFMSEPKSINDEKTEYFQNKSMEMTEIIPQMRYCPPSNGSNNDKTKIFHNKSMEITEALSNKPNRFHVVQTNIFSDHSTKMKDDFLNIQSSAIRNPFNDEKTTVYNNKSMEMTEAVSNMKFSTMPNCFTQEKTQVFDDDSLEMTGVFPFVTGSLPKSNTIDNEKTEYFQNKSMEMTEAISNVKCSINPKCTNEERTQFFHDKSMEITKAVPCIKFPLNCDDKEDKIEEFHNQSMEMTEVITPLKLTMNQITMNKSTIPTLPEDKMNINFFTKSPRHAEVDDNYLMEFTEPIQSIKRPYNLIDNGNKSAKLPTPIIKNPRYSTISEQKKNISEDLEKLHQLLHQNISEIDSLSKIELQRKNHCTSVTNVISDQQPTSDDSNAVKMIEAIPPIQLMKVYENRIQNTNHASSVDIPNLVKINSINSTPTVKIDESNASSNNKNNLHTFKEHDLLIENQSSTMIESLQSANKSIIKQSKVVEPTLSNPSCNNTLEVPNLLKVFNEVVKETPNMLKNNDVSLEKNRFESKYINNAQMEDDITYELTRPNVQHKEIEKTFLEFEEAPSFIYDQNLSDQYLKKSEENEMYEPLMPELSNTEVFSPINTINFQNNQITNELVEKKPSNANEIKNNIRDIDCKLSSENKEEKINRRATFLIKKHDFTDIVVVPTHNKVESTETKLIDQSNSNNEVFNVDNKVSTVTNFDEEEHEKIDNEIKDCEFNKEQSACRPSTQMNLLDVDNESHVNDNQLISTNTVSKKKEKEHVRDVIKKLKKDEDNLLLSENDSIIRRIVQNAKEYADLRNKMKYMVKLSTNTTNKTEEATTLENVDESVRDSNDIMDPYTILEEGLRMYEENDKCLWKIYDINPKMICIEYYKTALLLLIQLRVPEDSNENEQITNVRIISRLNDEELAILKIVDNLIIQIIDSQSLEKKYKTYDDIPKLIQYATNEIKVIYDFYDDFEKLNRKYVIKILEDNRISFILRSQSIGKIIQLSIKLNFFTKIHAEDFESISLLGSNIQTHVKELAKSIKPGSNFLSTYIKQVEQLLNVF